MVKFLLKTESIKTKKFNLFLSYATIEPLKAGKIRLKPLLEMYFYFIKVNNFAIITLYEQ